MRPVQNIAQQEYKLKRAFVWRLQLFIYWEMTAEETTGFNCNSGAVFFFFLLPIMCAEFLRDKHVKGVGNAVKSLGMMQEDHVASVQLNVKSWRGYRR